MCKKVSVCLKSVFASSIVFSLNHVPLYTTVSKNAVSVSNVSAVNSIVGWYKIACSMRASMSGLLMSHKLGGGSCNFQPRFRGWSVIFVPKGVGGSFPNAPAHPLPYFLTSP